MVEHFCEPTQSTHAHGFEIHESWQRLAGGVVGRRRGRHGHRTATRPRDLRGAGKIRDCTRHRPHRGDFSRLRRDERSGRGPGGSRCDGRTIRGRRRRGRYAQADQAPRTRRSPRAASRPRRCSACGSTGRVFLATQHFWVRAVAESVEKLVQGLIFELDPAFHLCARTTSTSSGLKCRAPSEVMRQMSIGAPTLGDVASSASSTRNAATTP